MYVKNHVFEFICQIEEWSLKLGKVIEMLAFFFSIRVFGWNIEYNSQFDSEKCANNNLLLLCMCWQKSSSD